MEAGNKELEMALEDQFPSDVVTCCKSIICIEKCYLYTQYYMYKEAKNALTNLYNLLKITITLIGKPTKYFKKLHNYLLRTRAKEKNILS